MLSYVLLRPTDVLYHLAEGTRSDFITATDNETLCGMSPDGLGWVEIHPSLERVDAEHEESLCCPYCRKELDERRHHTAFGASRLPY